MLDVFQEADLAGPTAAGQLPGHMLGNPLIVGEQSDLLEVWLQLAIRAGDIPEGRKGLAKRLHGFDPRDIVRPMTTGVVGPPPLRCVAGRPGDAVVGIFPRAGDPVVPAAEPREGRLDFVYHQ
jgi:hypothetical protein